MCKTIKPDEAVAYGAAVQGAIMKAGGSGEVAEDTSSAHLV